MTVVAAILGSVCFIAMGVTMTVSMSTRLIVFQMTEWIVVEVRHVRIRVTQFSEVSGAWTGI